MRVVILPVLLAVVGCAVAPRVDYNKLSDRPFSDTSVPYALTDSIIVIGTHGDAKAGGLTDTKGVVPVELGGVTATCTSDGCDHPLVALAVPTDYTAEYLAIQPRSRRLVSTSVAPTYVMNSLRLRSLTVEAKDHKIEVINAIGSVASGVLSLASGVRKSGEGAFTETATDARIDLPLVLDLAEAKAAASITDPAKLPGLPGNADWHYSARFLDDPLKQGFLERESARRLVHASLLTSICRPLRLELIHPSATIVLVVTVADPDYVMAIPLPAKGAVTPHPLCGADVQAQPVTEVGADEIAAAFFKQVAAIRAARP